MARAMSREECLAFLLERPRTAKLATVRKDGRSHVAPIWFDLDGDMVVFTTGRDTLKGSAIRRDPRVCLCVDDEKPPFAFVVIDGIASASDDLDDMLAWATRIGGRYMGSDRADEYGRRNAVPEEMLVRVTPSRVIARAGVAD